VRTKFARVQFHALPLAERKIFDVLIVVHGTALDYFDVQRPLRQSVAEEGYRARAAWR
jgi:hypothetical protein